ncbi:cation diffusion facilitator family transporter [Methanoregula formicica]|uniref:Cation diffusion facilitator family transporter n=1 Tax=Methanoregula formicica (strain DSM 22288 / NBRC 105244 / SMSP) TaxID=593750 RepID=L0HCP6_METFS|nr:cation diffusion facilitator family transporter [Methanoregula formicica]AGB01571.1 cation diffusion facilitator family transporter [Methanoregula formicica SMSP]
MQPDGNASGNREPKESREKLVFTGFCMDLLILVPETAALILSGSAALLSDVFKCANEILATLFALLIIRRMKAGGKFTYDYGMGKFETLTRIITGSVMVVSIIILVLFTIQRLMHPEKFEMIAAYIGIPLMIFASIADYHHWHAYHRRSKEDPSPIMEAQWRLRRAKTFSNLLLLFALTFSVICIQYEWAHYIDPIVSFVIIGFLLFAGYREFSSSLPDLFDKTLDEELQLVILRELSGSFDKYDEFHGVRSRRSGSRIYIEIFLGFDPEQKMGDVQQFATTLKRSLENEIAGSVVSVVLSRE